MMQSKKTIQYIYLKTLNQKILSVQNVSRGYENNVYIVRSDTDTTVLRIPKKSAPLFSGKHQLLREYWAIKAWKKLHIPMPKILVLDYSKKIALFDFVIETFIPGNHADILKSNREESKPIMRRLGYYLKKMHTVRTKKYGLLRAYKVGEKNTWRDAVLPEIQRICAKMSKKKMLPVSKIQKIKNYFDKNSDVLQFNTPRLIHNDIYEENIILRNGKISGIIDFGDVYSGDPIFDVARAYQGLYGIPHLNTMLKAYGKIDKKKFDYYVLFHACDSFVFFYDSKPNKWVRQSIKLINSIIE